MPIASQRIPGEGMTVSKLHVVLSGTGERFGNISRAIMAPNGSGAARDSFARTDNVRRNAEVSLGGEHAAGPREASDDFVEDEKHVVAIGRCRARIWKYSGVGVMIPPVFPMGSTRIPATVSGSSLTITSSKQRAAKRLASSQEGK